MTYYKISKVLRSNTRFKVLKALAGGEKLSAQIEKATGLYRSHVSRTLTELLEIGLIACVNPNDTRYKFYKIIPEGRKILKEVTRLKKEIG